MKRLATIIMLLALLVAPVPAFTATDCTVLSTVVDSYPGMEGGWHSVIRVTVTQSGTTFSFTTADFIQRVAEKWVGYIYWIGIDPTGTLDAAPQLTITDAWGFTQFSDTTSFHVTNSVKVVGNSYDGQYVRCTPGMTFSFNDVGTTETITLYFDVVK